MHSSKVGLRLYFHRRLILSMGGCLVGGVCSRGCLVRGGGVCSRVGGAWWRPPGMATAAGGTHPIAGGNNRKLGQPPTIYSSNSTLSSNLKTQTWWWWLVVQSIQSFFYGEMNINSGIFVRRKKREHCIFIVHKRSLQRLCFYTCQSFCSQVGCLGPGLGCVSAQVGCPGPGLGGSLPRGGVQARGMPRPMGCVSQHALRQTPPPPPADGHCNGRYASYWNAFLFVDIYVNWWREKKPR